MPLNLEKPWRHEKRFNLQFFAIGKDIFMERTRKALLTYLCEQFLLATYPGMAEDTRKICTTKLVNTVARVYGIVPDHIGFIDVELLDLITNGQYHTQLQHFLIGFFTPQAMIEFSFKQHNQEEMTVEQKIAFIDKFRRNYLCKEQSIRTMIRLNETDEVKVVFDNGHYWIEKNDKPASFDKQYFKDWVVPETETVNFGIYLYILMQNSANMEDLESQLPEHSKQTVLSWIGALGGELEPFFSATLVSAVKTDFINNLSFGGGVLNWLASHNKIKKIEMLFKDKLLTDKHFSQTIIYGRFPGANPLWHLMYHLYLVFKAKDLELQQKQFIFFLNVLLENAILKSEQFTAPCIVNAEEQGLTHPLIHRDPYKTIPCLNSTFLTTANNILVTMLVSIPDEYLPSQFRKDLYASLLHFTLLLKEKIGYKPIAVEGTSKHTTGISDHPDFIKMTANGYKLYFNCDKRWVANFFVKPEANEAEPTHKKALLEQPSTSM